MGVQCLIPAAGKGTRMRPLTHTLPKAMLPVAGLPTIFHIIEKAAQAGVQDFVIITGYLRELMESEIREAYPNLSIKFVEQKEQKGLGHALFQAKEAIRQDDSLLVVYGDTLFEADLSGVVHSPLPMIGVFEVADPRRFGVVEVDSEDYITNFVEKPDHFVSNLALPGVNYFPQAAPLFDALEHIIQNGIKTKNEYQATDAFSLMIKERSIKMKYFKMGSWDDAGTLEAMLETNQAILKRLGNKIEGTVENCKIIEPVYIARGAYMTGGVIGPNVSLGRNSRVKNCHIENSIIDNDCELTNSRLSMSLLGRRVQLKDISGQVTLGDDCQVQG